MIAWHTQISSPPAHPRVCGEHRLSPPWGLSTAGSSPRVRGTYSLFKAFSSRYRLIPACAGNIYPHVIRQRLLSAHPRVCGEHVAFPIDDFPYNGSSPRVRGTFLLFALFTGINRLIPACAGNIDSHEDTQDAQPAHPRVCGEHSVAIQMADTATGSSPRVRGT